MNERGAGAVKEPSPADALVRLAALGYASPALSVWYGIAGFKIEKVEPSELQETA